MVEGKIMLNENDVDVLNKNKNNFVNEDKSQLKKHVIGYIDFLGTKRKISSEEQLNFLKKIKYIYHSTVLKYEEQREFLNQNLYDKIKKDNEGVKFSDIVNPVIKYKIFSDNIILAIEIPSKEPYMNKYYTLDLYSRMIAICGQFQAMAIFCGLLLRGGITVGNLYLDETFVYGDGLLTAFDMEHSQAKDPRIILNEDFVDNFSTNKKSYCKDSDKFLFINYYSQLGLTNYITEDMARYVKDTLIKLKNEAPDEKAIEKVNWAIDYHNKYFREHSKEEEYLIKYLI